MHITFFIRTIQSRFLCRSLQTWRVIAANKNKNKGYLYSLNIDSFVTIVCVYQLFTYLFLFPCVAPYMFSPAGIKGWTDRTSM